MNPSRRSFFKTALGAAALSRGGRVYAASGPRDSSFDPWVEIDTANFKHNAAEISRRVSGRPILAVIKNNGYGTGVVNVARALEPERVIAGFAVVKLNEAHTLRVATFFDAQEGSRPEDLAASCDSPVYDLTMHLSALLPRRLL